MAWQPTRLVRFLLLAGIVVIAMLVRLHPLDHLLQPQGLLIHDLDTLRRLARLAAIDRAGTYPILETLDGYPGGTMLHWTLPMDWVIRGLDPLARWMLPTARAYEAGAVVAGPLLSALAVCALVLLSRRLFGFWPGLLAGALYGLSYSCVNTSLLGNGDHQTLQQLAVAIAVPSLWLAVRAAQSSPAKAGHGGALGPQQAAMGWAVLSGVALGFAIWVSTELMLLFYVLAASLAVVALWPWRNERDREACRTVALPWGIGVLALVVIGSIVEQRGDPFTMHWDAVSGFQSWQVVVFVSLPVGLRVRQGPWAALWAGAGALALGLLPFAFTAVRAAFTLQIHAASEANVWLQSEVSEFRGLLSGGLGTLFERDSLLLLAVPFVLRFANPVQLLGALTLLGTLGLYLWEIKLGHLFAAVSPLALVAAWPRVSERVPAVWRRRVALVAAVACIGAVFVQRPKEREAVLRNNDLMVREICAKVAGQRAAGEDASVLAPWDMGAPLMYHAGVGVVASGYHRNLEGIRDAYRFLLADVDARDAALEILRRRHVRWVVAWYSRSFMLGGALTIGRPPLRTDREFLPAALRTMFWKLRYESVPGFKLVAEGPRIQLGFGAPEPIYRLWEVAR